MKIHKYVKKQSNSVVPTLSIEGWEQSCGILWKKIRRQQLDAEPDHRIWTRQGCVESMRFAVTGGRTGWVRDGNPCMAPSAGRRPSLEFLLAYST